MSEISTQDKLLEIGKKEFLEKGFKDASLRKIVKEAGFTLGAFYGYFPNKESLFQALVDEHATVLLEKFQKVQDDYNSVSIEQRLADLPNASVEHLYWMLDYIYDNFEVFKLIICQSAGTEYENFLDQMVEIEQRSADKLMRDLIENGYLETKTDQEVVHMLSSSLFHGIFEIVIHDMPKKKAVDYVMKLQEFFAAGWIKIWGL